MVVAMAMRASPEQYFNRQPIVQGVEQPVLVAQPAPAPQVYVILPGQQDYTIIIIAGVIIVGIIGIVALVALIRR
jgi:hypothetical protein